MRQNTGTQHIAVSPVVCLQEKSPPQTSKATHTHARARRPVWCCCDWSPLSRSPMSRRYFSQGITNNVPPTFGQSLEPGPATASSAAPGASRPGAQSRFGCTVGVGKHCSCLLMVVSWLKSPHNCQNLRMLAPLPTSTKGRRLGGMMFPCHGGDVPPLGSPWVRIFRRFFLVSWVRGGAF